MNASPHGLFGEGLGVALVTPFLPDGEIDDQALVRVVQHVVHGGADFVVALGSTGEASMLQEHERNHVVGIVREHIGSAKLIVGTGASATAQAATWTQRARSLGADAALVVVPPYTKPTQDGIVAHFQAIAEAAPDVPLIAYNVPSRTGVNLEPATMQELWRLPTVVALKESSGDLLQIARIAAEKPDDRTLLAGDDALLLSTIAVGGYGVVSVAGNVVPEAMRDLLATARAGQLDRAQSQFAALLPLFLALSAEPNPIPIKCALAFAGIAGALPRLPLQLASEPTNSAVQQAMQHLQEAISHA